MFILNLGLRKMKISASAKLFQKNVRNFLKLTLVSLQLSLSMDAITYFYRILIQF
jgi:hypothetical protein